MTLQDRIAEITRILSPAWPESDRLEGVLRVVRAMGEESQEHDALEDLADRERESRKAAERERDAHRQHAIQMERERDARVTLAHARAWCEEMRASLPIPLPASLLAALANEEKAKGPSPIDPVRDVIGERVCAEPGCGIHVATFGGRCARHHPPVARLYSRAEVEVLLESLRERCARGAEMYYGQADGFETERNAARILAAFICAVPILPDDPAKGARS